MQTVTREKIAIEIQERLGLSGVICEELVMNIFKSATDAILQNQVLKIKNLGSFSLHQKNARPGRNWNTAEATTIEARKVIRFVPSRGLKKRLNGAG
jgi:integration host factor subunit alpha